MSPLRMNPPPALFHINHRFVLRLFATLALVLFFAAPRASAAAFVHLEPDHAKQFVPPHLVANLDQTISTTALRDDQPSTPRNRFGRMTVIAWPLYMALRLLHAYVNRNWGTDIILMTVLFNLAMIWPRVKSMKSSAKMARLQPQVEAIRKRRTRTALDPSAQSEMNAEIMALYQSEGVSVVGGCLPLLFQMPLLFGLFSVFQNAAELNRAHWCWLTDLARPDPLHILPAIIIASMTLTQFISPSPGMSATQRKILALVTALIFGFSLAKYASGLSLYWATGNLINLFVQLILNKSRLADQTTASDPAPQ